jgi:thioredoxin-like negative regulator of GroEL
MSDRWDDKHELVAMVERDPVGATMACSMALMQLQQKREEALNHLLAVPYAVALYLLTDWDE